MIYSGIRVIPALNNRVLVVNHFLDDSISFDTHDDITTVLTNLYDSEKPEEVEEDEDFNIVKITLTFPEDVVHGIDEKLRKNQTAPCRDPQVSSSSQLPTYIETEIPPDVSNSPLTLKSNEVISQFSGKTSCSTSTSHAICPDQQAQSQDKAITNRDSQELQTSLGRALATVFGSVTEDLREFDHLRQKHRCQPDNRYF